MTIIIINDGTVEWGADREELFAAMADLGFDRDGGHWHEPDGDAYTALCQRVQPAAGFAPEDQTEEWSNHPHRLTYRPDMGAWEVVNWGQR